MITDSVAVALLAVLGALGWLAVRRVRLVRGGGVRVLARRPAAGWRPGMGRYEGNLFAWYRLNGLRAGPDVVLDRTSLAIAHRRPRAASDGAVVPAGATVLRVEAGCTGAAGTELAMSADVLTGFQSWLEAGPPGTTTGYRQAS